MSMLPRFPAFKSIGPEDRDVFCRALYQYQPETSEMTFTNLFIWRSHYRFKWSLYKDWILILCNDAPGEAYGMMPIGPPGRGDAVMMFLEWLHREKGVVTPSVERADKRLVLELEETRGLTIEPARDQFDYVYLRDDLVQLGGNKYRSKRNHINKITRNYSFTYEPLEERHLGACLELQLKWCQARRCEDDLSLLSEWGAIREILSNYSLLDLKGGVVMVDGNVEAFTLGELLNDQTAVIHIEKANPEIAEFYTVVNQQCAEKCWGDVQYINREQDLGVPGLREAKLSYNPHHMVEKYRIICGESRLLAARNAGNESVRSGLFM
ncbi:MAG: hypothetical protein C0392_01370 [Syntrophus sp. (in: bacteria)]|nr:hypothetical protein [Syntrophus sp. (in: bacteria)]